MRKAKSPLLYSLQKAFRLSLQAEIEEQTSLKVIDKYESKGASRRKFLTEASQLGLVIGSGSLLTTVASCNSKDSDNANINESNSKYEKVEIAIIGGGIAGLHAAHVLSKSGIVANVYEADSRLGGRIKTKTDLLGKGLVTEIGGEFIDSNHEDMRNLAREFGIKEIDTAADTLIKDKFFVEGKEYSLESVVNEFRKVTSLIQKDKSVIEEEDYSGVGTTRLDNITLKDYIQKLQIAEWLRKLLDAAYVAELGLESDKQSALNFIDLIGVDTDGGKFDIFGESDERYKLEGGNQLLIEKISSNLKAQIRTEYKMTAIAEKGTNYIVSFENGKEVEAKYVILTVPFSILRNCDLTNLRMSSEKRKCIDELGYGTNAKLLMGFKSRIWRKNNHQGYLFNDKIHNGWDNSHFQNENDGEGGFTVFVGGDAGTSMSGNVTHVEKEIEKYLPIIETAFKGSNAFNNKAEIAAWPVNPFTLCSYSCYLPGQWTTISGTEIEPVGNVYFAGEHCSEEFQGYMNGGAKTGRVAAETIINIYVKESVES